MRLGGGLLKIATATPFCTLNNKDFVFWSEDGNADYEVSEPINGNIITLSKAQARKCFKFMFDGKQRLFMADGGIEFCFTDESIIKVYAPLECAPKGFKHLYADGIFAVYKFTGKSTAKSAEDSGEKSAGKSGGGSAEKETEKNTCP